MATVRRYGRRWGAVTAVLAIGLSACTATTPRPPTNGDSASIGRTAAESTTTAPAEPTTQPTNIEPTNIEPTIIEPTRTQPTRTQPTSDGSSGEPTVGSAVPSSTVPPSTVTPSTVPAPAVPTYAPTGDADAVRGDCPYLDEDQVQADTGQRVGGTRIRPAEPQPVCEFLRNDGEFLARVRVLQLESEAVAVSAVDFYVPREASNPESRPAGWSGGSLAADGGSTYGVSKGTTAVIAQTNQKQSVYARLLVLHAIGNLEL